MVRLAVVAALFAAPVLTFAEKEAGQEELSAQLRQGKEVFETMCGACHSLSLPKSQRLNRANWEWVLDDMVKKFGCPLDEEQQVLIVDYLVETHGPGSDR